MARTIVEIATIRLRLIFFRKGLFTILITILSLTLLILRENQIDSQR